MKMDEEKGPAADEAPQTQTDEDGVPFKDLSGGEKCRSVVVVVLKLLTFLGSLYMFICSLGLLESAFQLLGGKTAGGAFSSGVLSNPFAGLMIGVLATVMVQSSSTSSSIVVAMVGSEIIPVEKAVPIIMGANIGTSVTNTLVSLAQASDRKQFERAFAGATVHDMFNWLSVIVLLPLEIGVGYLAWLSHLLVHSLGIEGNNSKTPDLLKAVTGPLIKSIVQVNKNIIKDVATSANGTSGDVLKRWCVVEDVTFNETRTDVSTVNITCGDVTTGSFSAWAAICDHVRERGLDASKPVQMDVGFDFTRETTETKHIKRCDHLFAQSDLSDAAAGGLLLVVSLLLILLTLYLIVKILNSMLQGPVSRTIQRVINADLPAPWGYLSGYVAMLVGMGMTILVQSSSVFTSTLTPLVGLGLVSIERMYPMTLGSNVGTTVTALLAALSQSGDKLQHSLQIAFCHLFFNISGILLFYPLPFMRWPIGMAKVLGKTTSKHRWFAIFYLILMFVLLPGVVFGLSYAGYIYLGAIGGPLLLFFLLLVLINVLQVKKPNWLPTRLRDWNFLPLCCHSLTPVDRAIAAVCRCGYCRTLQDASHGDGVEGSDKDVLVDASQGKGEKNAGVGNGDVRNGHSEEMKHSSRKDDGVGMSEMRGRDNMGYEDDSTRF